MFLSRVELSPDATRQEAFWREVSRPYGAHQALWALLARDAEQPREFLFRAEAARGRPSFLVLSKQPPKERGDLPWVLETKAFAPRLQIGQRLGFKLRASPVVRRGEAVVGKANPRVHRHDVVIDLARRLEAQGQPLPEPSALAHQAGQAWLTRQGARAGFDLVQVAEESIGDDGLLTTAGAERAALRVEGYQQHRITRRGEEPIRFSSLDFEGVLKVTDPDALLAAVGKGLGPQKAFGCGLLLLRRI